MFVSIKKFLITLITFFLIDVVWIQYVASRLYNNYIGDILIEDFRIIPAVIFYILHISVLHIVTNLHNPTNIYKQMVISFLVGITAYGTYNLTNYSILEAWHINIVVPDTLWGGFLSAISVLIANKLVNKPQKNEI